LRSTRQHQVHEHYVGVRFATHAHERPRRDDLGQRGIVQLAILGIAACLGKLQPHAASQLGLDGRRRAWGGSAGGALCMVGEILACGSWTHGHSVPVTNPTKQDTTSSMRTGDP
jgi:hypothetical protein